MELVLWKQINWNSGSCYEINSSRNPTFSDLHHSTKFLNLSTPDDLLAEVAIGPLSAQETGVQQKTFVWKFALASANTLVQKKSLLTRGQYRWNWCWRWVLELLIIFPIKVDLIGELRWRTLESEFSCGTTAQAFTDETSDGPFFW